MGCNVQKEKTIVISNLESNCSTGDWKKNVCFSVVRNSINTSSYNIKYDYNKSITNMLWVKVIDYLSYNDLKEVGKINRKFNMLVRTNNVLVKFFKKKTSIYSRKSNIVSFDAFGKFQFNN